MVAPSNRSVSRFPVASSAPSSRSSTGILYNIVTTSLSSWICLISTDSSVPRYSSSGCPPRSVRGRTNSAVPDSLRRERSSRHSSSCRNSSRNTTSPTACLSSTTHRGHGRHFTGPGSDCSTSHLETTPLSDACSENSSAQPGNSRLAFAIRRSNRRTRGSRHLPSPGIGYSEQCLYRVALPDHGGAQIEPDSALAPGVLGFPPEHVAGLLDADQRLGAVEVSLQ